MGEKHDVKEGEHLPKIATQYRIRNYRTIWDHAENKALRDKRKTASILAVGDEVFIPDHQGKEEPAALDKVHRFRVLSPPLKLTLRLHDLDDKPVVGVACELEVEGKKFPLTTNADGVIEHEIPHDASTGTLRIGDLGIPLQIGYLQPIDEVPGWRARLNNLGYDAGDSDDTEDPKLRSAVEEFQADYQLAVDGDCGSQTQKKLKERHGC